MMIQIKRPHVFIVRKEASSSKSSFCVQTILQSIGTSLTSEARPSRECPDGGSTMVHQRGERLIVRGRRSASGVNITSGVEEILDVVVV
eukprot:CAMPEP_0201235798 /NCGR_PEP_ID=MMETSP0852-20130820/7357_1 /ASSEMBLY_ACC=CAM_ASM_000632 /TAXON_ID=183588 /ORGANISM="Pseudo-nitzschia fraudulenta, Strain WWA7" /LENGTH=88 /DNA_ID=CAMNT_0047529523 /DNA_START=125 /DNA_END=388 /DNA_ORIENTATION=-